MSSSRVVLRLVVLPQRWQTSSSLAGAHLCPRKTQRNLRSIRALFYASGIGESSMSMPQFGSWWAIDVNRGLRLDGYALSNLRPVGQGQVVGLRTLVLDPIQRPEAKRREAA